MAAGVRLAAHRRAADALLARGAPALRLARHPEQTAASGDQRSIELLVRWAEEAEALAPAVAARALRPALRLHSTSDARPLLLVRRLAER